MCIAVEGDRDKSRAANKVKLHLHDLRMSGCLPQDHGVVEFFFAVVILHCYERRIQMISCVQSSRQSTKPVSAMDGFISVYLGEPFGSKSLQ